MTQSAIPVDGPMPGAELTLRIDALGRGGDGLARLEGGLLAFVPRTLPGEQVRVRVRDRRGRRLELELLEVLEPAAARVPAPCAHFARCGGCQMQHLSYAGQLVEKRAQLVRKLTRLLGAQAENLVEPVAAAPQPFGYRNKNLLQRGPDGFGFFDLHGERLVAVDACPLATPECNAVMATVRAWLAAEGAPCAAFLLAVLVRSGATTQHAILVGDERARTEQNVAAVRTLAARLPEVGLFLSWKPADSRRAFGAELVHLAGPERIDQRIGAVVLDLGPTSFAQVNGQVAAALYEHVTSELAAGASDPVLDLFCGSGALSLHLARGARSVLGVELDHRALVDAERSAARAGVTNVGFRAGRCETIAERLWKKGERFRHATFNPPRVGMHPALVDWLAKLGLERAVYVSCSPPTLVRDLDRLVQHGFRVARIVPFDQFAQTYHLEVAVTLERACRAPRPE